MAKRIESAAETVQGLIVWFIRLAGPVFAAVIVYAVARLAFEMLLRLHASLALVPVLLAAWAAFVIPGYVREIATRAQINVGLSTFFASFLLAVFAASGLSFLIHSLGEGHYSVPLEYSMGTFADMYVYEFLHFVPFLKVPETLKLVSPISTLDFFGGVPVLAFKVYVALVLLANLKEWWKGTGAKPTAPEPS